MNVWIVSVALSGFSNTLYLLQRVFSSGERDYGYEWYEQVMHQEHFHQALIIWILFDSEERCHPNYGVLRTTCFFFFSLAGAFGPPPHPTHTSLCWISLAALSLKKVPDLGLLLPCRQQKAFVGAGTLKASPPKLQTCLGLPNLEFSLAQHAFNLFLALVSFPFIQTAFLGFHRNEGLWLGPSLWKLWGD